MFATCIHNLNQLHEMFSRQLLENTLESFEADTYRSYKALNFATRYFTSRQEDPHSPALSFSPNVDPKRILTSMITDRYFHGEDNKVNYYISNMECSSNTNHS
jgi:hypothetical protein